jgi:hypothetical protein
MHKEIDRKEKRVYGGGMSDATTTASAKKGSMPKWLDVAGNVLASLGLGLPVNTVQAGPTHGETNDALRGTVSSVFDLGGGFSAVSTGIGKQGEKIVHGFSRGIAETVAWLGIIKPILTTWNKNAFEKAKNTTGDAMKTFGGVANDVVNGTEVLLKHLFFRFLGGRQESNSH